MKKPDKFPQQTIFMKAIPWILVLILLIAAGFFFTSNQKNETELTQLRQESVEFAQTRAALEEARKSQAQISDSSLGDKEKQELIRLRNEVGILRRDKQQLAAQSQKAQENSERLLQTQQARETQQAEQIQQLQQNQRLAQQQTQQPESDPVRNKCINNLRQIDGAKQQWALENKQPAEAVPLAQQIAPYFKGQTVPSCPSGGVYTLGNLETTPICSIPGHAISQ